MGAPVETANKLLVKRLYEEVFNQHRLAVLDTLLAPDFLDHAPLAGQAPGREGFRASVATGQARMPALHFTVEEIIAEGDVVALRLRMSIPHHGSVVAFTGMGFFRCQAGQIVEGWWNIETPDLS